MTLYHGCTPDTPLRRALKRRSDDITLAVKVISAWGCGICLGLTLAIWYGLAV